MELPQLFLSSSSARRQTLLKQLGVRFGVVEPNINESYYKKELYTEYVKRLALEKAKAGALLIQKIQNLPILGADTCIVIENKLLGKPANKDEFIAMVKLLSGKSHIVYSAVAVLTSYEAKTWNNESPKNTSDFRIKYQTLLENNVRLSVTKVTMRKISSSEQDAYWQCGEPMDKAGGYAIQGKGALFVKKIEGSYSGVMGLPLYETAELLQNHGINILTNISMS